MKNMSLQKIAAACGGTYCGSTDLLDREVSSVVIDSRKVEKDSLFVAIKGARVDGHSFIPQVMEKGALCAVSEQDLGTVPYPYIRVDSCEQALKDIAEHYRRSLDIRGGRDLRQRGQDKHQGNDCFCSGTEIQCSQDRGEL